MTMVESKEGLMDTQTQTLVEAGEILQTLSPMTLGAFLLVAEEETIKQDEIAETIGCARSTVSKYLQSLNELPVALVEKRGRQYTVTEDGEHVLGLIEGMGDRLGINLATVDWTDDEDKTAVDELLTPLHASRSAIPFFILHSVGQHAGSTDVLATPEQVRIEDVVDDITVRQRERGESTTAQQVRQIVRRFSDADAVEFDGGRIRLTEKGQEQVRLLSRLTDLIAEQQKSASPEIADQHFTDPTHEGQPKGTSSRGHSSRSETITGVPTPDKVGISQQIAPRGFSGGQDDRSPPGQEMPVIIPAYRLLFKGDKQRREQIGGPSRTLLPITTSTLGELHGEVERLIKEHDEDTQIEPYMTLQTESNSYFLSPARLALEEASHRAWQIVNEAYRIWHMQTENPRSEANDSEGQGNATDE